MTGTTADLQTARARGLRLVAIAYLLALAAGIAAWLACPGHPLLRLAVADAVATVVVFAFSYAYRNSSFYDPYWSVVTVPLAGALLLLGGGVAPLLREVLVGALVLAYAIRLTRNWMRGWTGLGHEDWRYVDLQAQTGRAYWLVSLLGIHLMPSVMTFLGCLPLWAALHAGSAPLGPLDALAAAVTAGALWLEHSADDQLHRWRATSPPRGSYLASGVWAWCRHPNYLGEMGFWWGLYLFALASGGAAGWSISGAVAITALFLFITIPMIEKRMAASRPDWAAHRARTFAVLPRRPRRPG